MLGNITITEANIRQNTGKEKKIKARKSYQNTDRLGSTFTTAFSSAKVLTAHFCSAGKERNIFWFVLISA